MNHHRGQQNGEEIGHDEHLQLIGQREDAEIAEQEQRYQPYYGQIERGEKHAHDASSQNHLFLSYHFTIY